MINADPSIVSQIMQLPNTLIGLCDAGAHIAQHCDAGLPSYVLGECVRDRGIMTLQEGVRRLTSEIADFIDLPTRGRIAPATPPTSSFSIRPR